MVAGKEIMALELGQGLRDHGHSVDYVTTLWGNGVFGQRLDALGFEQTAMRLGFISATMTLECIRMSLDQLVRLPGLWLDYRGFLKRKQPRRIIHTNWQHLLVLWPFHNQQRDWFWLHDVYPNKPQYRRLFFALNSCLAGFITVSNAVKNSLLRLGVPSEKIHVIHNGLNDPALDLFNDPAAPPHLGNRIGIVGQVEPWKGHMHLLESFAQIASRHPDAELHVFGTADSNYAHELKQRAANLGLSKRLVWHGFVTKRSDIYAGLDLCVVPSCLTEALPTVAIESAFFGIPVIATEIGGLPEIIEHERTGYILNPDNPEDLSHRLDTLLSDTGLRRHMGSEARKRAVSHFSRDRFVADFANLLNEPVQ
jgi:glycosyltransferase involved in cell wall biosynthesis